MSLLSTKAWSKRQENIKILKEGRHHGERKQQICSMEKYRMSNAEGPGAETDRVPGEPSKPRVRARQIATSAQHSCERVVRRPGRWQRSEKEERASGTPQLW